jgi:hypothetical protein
MTLSQGFMVAFAIIGFGGVAMTALLFWLRHRDLKSRH